MFMCIYHENIHLFVYTLLVIFAVLVNTGRVLVAMIYDENKIIGGA